MHAEWQEIGAKWTHNMKELSNSTLRGTWHKMVSSELGHQRESGAWLSDCRVNSVKKDIE